MMRPKSKDICSDFGFWRMKQNPRLYKQFRRIQLNYSKRTNGMIFHLQLIKEERKMKEIPTFIIPIMLLLLLPGAQAGAVAPCPSQYQTGSIVSQRISVSNTRSLIVLQPNEDVQCYNYSLPYAFTRVPQVAIAIDGLESVSTNDLFFVVKPIESDSLSSVPLLVRTHWQYTRWTKISFSFLASDRLEFELGYYQIDTGVLASCANNKKIEVFLPFKQFLQQNGQISHNVFLHGFEISTKSIEQNRSPFEIQIAETSANITGIAMLIQVTTITQVHALHISYIAFTQTVLQVKTGSYVYYFGDSNIEFTPSELVGANYARVHGLTGFIINHHREQFFFDVEWTGIKFIFSFKLERKYIQYFSYQYIFFTGSICADCQGFPISHNGTCVAECPPGTFITAEKVCISCGQGRYWNGTSCLKLCPMGQYLNFGTNQCECPAGMHWNNVNCISCSSGKVFNNQTKLCECPKGLTWNGYVCAQINRCENGKEWNIFSYICECPIGTRWNGTYCTSIKRCTGGQILNTLNQCVCPNGQYWDGYTCTGTGCINGQIWNGSSCNCPRGLNFNGTHCLECINGQVWNPHLKTCNCLSGYIWNGNFCERKQICQNGRVWNSILEQCICEAGYFWNGATCMVKPTCCCGKKWNEKTYECDCPVDFYWDGQSCVQCVNGKLWNSQSRKCECPGGTQWNHQFCVVIQSCQGGMIWNQNTWSCECPSYTVWNGKYCIANPCQGGQVWDNIKKSCVCPVNKILINGTCLPPEVGCIGGQIWDPTVYACKCPPGQWFNSTICIPITICRGNQIYNPLNNKCECPYGLVWLEAKLLCADPTCPKGEFWDGYGCSPIMCPPNSYFNGSECVCSDFEQQCQPWQYFDGTKCVYHPTQCPIQTKWEKSKCEPVSCPTGHYKQNGQCKPFPQLCPPPSLWSEFERKCECKNACPPGTFKNGNRCQPYKKCEAGQEWNYDRIMCMCPINTIWNGEACLRCTGGKVWKNGGCECPDGQFWAGSACETASNSRCSNIPNTFWNGERCMCKEGFIVFGIQCVCKGVVVDGKCDRCAHMKNSEWKYGICQCKQNFIQIDNKCIPKSSKPPGNTDSPASCNVATYFDAQQQRCLPCPDGCLSCQDCYTCVQCRPEFNFNSVSKLCDEYCGDGKKFVKQCDDGNNVDGDGCSMDCKIESGYNCRGGSPENKDTCLPYTPSAVTLTQTGQIRYSDRIILNVKLNYLPRPLLQSLDCNNRCSSVLVGKIVSGGGDGAVSIKSQYIPGTSFSFSLEINFGKPYINNFQIEIRVNPALGNKYFGGVDTSFVLAVKVVPGYLAKVEERDAL